LENRIIDYIQNNYIDIETDMNENNSISKAKTTKNEKTRKKREELSVNAIKTFKKEKVEITVTFS